MKNFVLFLSMLALSACSTFYKAPSASVDEATKKSALDAYARVLEKFVNDKGQIDFHGLRDNRADLNRYVAFVSTADLESFKGKERMAHYLNSYNALSMNLVIEKGIPKTNAGLKKVGFFFLAKMDIGGKEMSLHSYENELIRKAGDERVHFALNCMAVSCPRLPKTPFTAAKLDEELDREAKFFFSEPRNLTVNKEKKEIQLTEILKFFTEDFVPAKAPTLHDYVSKWTSQEIPRDYKIEFVDYDWSINDSKR